MILLNKLVRPLEHLLESDHKCLFLKLFYCASHLTVTALNTQHTANTKFILLLKMRMMMIMRMMMVLTRCQPQKGTTKYY